MPGEGEVEVGVLVGAGVAFVDRVFLHGDLDSFEGGFNCDETDLAPVDGCEVVDHALFDVVAGLEGVAESLAVGVKGVDVFDSEDDVEFGGEAVLEGVAAGAGLSLYGRRPV